MYILNVSTQGRANACSMVSKTWELMPNFIVWDQHKILYKQYWSKELDYRLCEMFVTQQGENRGERASCCLCRGIESLPDKHAPKQICKIACKITQRFLRIERPLMQESICLTATLRRLASQLRVLSLRILPTQPLRPQAPLQEKQELLNRVLTSFMTMPKLHTLELTASDLSITLRRYNSILTLYTLLLYSIIWMMIRQPALLDQPVCSLCELQTLFQASRNQMSIVANEFKRLKVSL